VAVWELAVAVEVEEPKTSSVATAVLLAVSASGLDVVTVAVTALVPDIVGAVSVAATVADA